MSADPRPPQALATRAALLLEAEKASAAAKRTRDALAEALQADIEEEIAAAAAAGDKKREAAARKIALSGATVSYVEAGTSTRLQEKRCVDKLEALGARLRALGEISVDDAAPYNSMPRAAYLKITARL